MITASNRKKLMTAAFGVAVTAATLPAVALTSAPAARADCEKWGIPWAPTFTWTQDFDTTGAFFFANPAPSDSPVIASFSADAVSTYYPVGNIPGKATGSIKGDSVHFWVEWNDGKTGDYRGLIDQNGYASGRTSGGGMSANWHFDKPLARCPAPPPAAPPPHGPARELIFTIPPEVDIDNVSGFEPGVAVTVKNRRTVDLHCKYEAVPRPPTVLQNSVREFDMNGAANFKISGAPTGTTWDVTVRCPNQVAATLVHVF